MQKVYRYVHENKFPELKDKNVTYLLKICSGRSKQSVEFLLQQKKGTTVMFKWLSRKFEIKLGLSKRISQERWKTRENIQQAASARKVTRATELRMILVWQLIGQANSIFIPIGQSTLAVVTVV